MNHRTDNDQTLLQQISAGDEQAFKMLYDQQWPQVYAYLESIVKSPQAAEEMVIDLFIKLWDGRSWLPQVDNIGGFLRTAARNKALDYLKSMARNDKKIAAYRADMILQAAQGTDHRLMDAEVQKIWNEAVAQLSPQRRNVFLLHREEGRSYKEIAGQLNISAATVKKTMSAALESIREFLKAHYSDTLAALLLWIML